MNPKARSKITKAARAAKRLLSRKCIERKVSYVQDSHTWYYSELLHHPLRTRSMRISRWLANELTLRNVTQEVL